MDEYLDFRQMKECFSDKHSQFTCIQKFILLLLLLSRQMAFDGVVIFKIQNGC